MKWLLLIALAGVSLSAGADTYKCTDHQGGVTYQQKPCAPGIVSKKVEINETRLTDDADSEAVKNAARLQRLHDAFRARLNAGDLDGARALAISPEEFKLVDDAAELKRKNEEKRRAEHAADCQEKATELGRLQQQKFLHPEDNALRNRVNEAQTGYDASCK